MEQTSRVLIIDSHTGGEPTRVVVEGGPDLGSGSIGDRLLRFRNQFDHYRSAIVNEPRGSEAIVGALICEPVDTSCVAGVIFFNNVGYLGMCGHGTIGLAVTLAHLKRIKPGRHKIETPVGTVDITLHDANQVTVDNVTSYRSATDATVDVPGFGPVKGDVAWGGNWFFLTNCCPIEIKIENLEALTDYTWRVRRALTAAGVTGDHGGEIDHIEVFGAATGNGADSKNFVLCPGKSYDRSPCGTGTSAKLACLYAAGKLREGDVWRQESLIGSVFEGSIRVRDGKVYPSIKGSAYVTAEATLILNEADPFRWGIRTDPSHHPPVD